MAATNDKRSLEIVVNGKKAESSIKDMEAAVAVLNNQMRKLPKNSDAFTQKKKEYQDMRQHVKGIKDDAYKLNDHFQKGVPLVNKMGGAIKVAMASTIILGIVGVIKDLVSYLFNVESEFNKLQGTIQQFAGITGKELDEATQKVKALSATFEDDSQDIIRAANAMSKEFGISFSDALGKIEKGYIAGANAGGDMLEQVSEYSTHFASAGASAEEFTTILAKSTKEGIFSDKGADVVKEFGLRIREQTSSTSDAMKQAFGKEFTKKIFEGINNGSLTTVQALEKVSEKMNDSTIPANTLQTAIADVFGGPGEDAGLRYLQSLTEISGGIDAMIDPTNNLIKARTQQLSLEEELAAAEADLAIEMKGSNKLWKQASTTMMIFGTKALALLISGFKDQLMPTLVGSMAALGAFVKMFSESLEQLRKGNLSDAWDLVDFSKVSATATKRAKEHIQSTEKERARIKAQEAANQTAAAQQQVIEEETKKREARLKQAKITSEEVAKQRQLLRVKEAAATAALEDLRIQVIQDQWQRKEERIQYQHQQKLAKLVGNEQQITDQKKLLEQLRDQELEQLRLEQKAAKKAKQTEEETLQLEELALKEEAEKMQLELKFQTLLNTEMEKEQQLYDLKKKFLEAKLQLLQEAGKGESKEALKLQTQLLALDTDHHQKKLDNEAKTHQLKQQLQQQGFSTARDFLSLGIGLLSQDENSRKKHAEKIKAFSTAQTVIAGLFEVQQIWQHANSNPLNAIIPGFGAAMAAIQTGIAVGRTVMAVNKINATKYAKGGMTRAFNQVPIQDEGITKMADNVGSFADGGQINGTSIGIIGERGAEWVAPHWMLKSPEFSGVIAQLEQQRQQKTPRFATGGSTQGPIKFNSPKAPPETNHQQQQLEKLNEILEVLQAFPEKLQVHNNINEVDELLKTINELDQQSSIK